ncbi:MAG: Eco57I restriction-modification methylase domain-containing protein [Promethearchaeota archaeon]
MNSFINLYKITLNKLQVLFNGKTKDTQEIISFCQDLLKRTVFFAFYINILDQKLPPDSVEGKLPYTLALLSSLKDLKNFKPIADIFFPLKLKLVESLEKKEERVINNTLKKFIESFSWESIQNSNNKVKKNSVTPEIFELIYHSENPRNRGVVFTPYWCAYLMVESCLKRHIMRLLNLSSFSIHNLNLHKQQRDFLKKYFKDIRLLDISVGCGTLYLAAFDCLITLHNQFGILGKKLNSILKRICSKNLYGVDIDEKALIICKVRLILRILKIDPNIQIEDILEIINSVNLKSGNSIIGFINNPGISKKCNYNQLLVQDLTTNETNSLEILNSQSFFHWFLEFPRVFDMSEILGFDVIIGNPPYIGYRYIDKTTKRILRHLYSRIYTGLNDYYYYFIWRAKQLLAPDGSCVLIVPRYFLEARYAQKLRSELFGYGYVDVIVDFREFKIFPKGINSLVLYMTENSTFNPQSHILVLKKYNLSSQTLLQELQANMNGFSLKPSQIFHHYTFNHCESLNGKYLVASKSLISLIKRIENQCVPLNQVCGMGTGYHSGKDKVFSPNIIKKNGKVIALVENKGIVNQFPLETELVKEIVKTPNVLPFMIIWDNKYVLLTKRGININDYPYTKHYLEQFKETLMKRYEVRKNLANWYEIAQVRNLQLFKAKLKIICPYRARIPRFAIDKRQRYSSIDCTSIVLTNEDLDIYYILGVLNSELIELYLYSIAKKLDAQKIELYPKTISNIPIKIPTTKEDSALVTKIADLTRNLCSVLESCEFTPKQYQHILRHGKRAFIVIKKDNQEIKRLIERLDYLVYKLYGLENQIEILKREITHPDIESIGDVKSRRTRK